MTIELLVGGLIGYAVLRRKHVGDATSVRVSLTKTARPERSAVVRRLLRLAPEVAFVAWLWVVTGGAAFSPFAFVQDGLGWWGWPPVLTVLSLVGLVARVGRLVARGLRADDPG